MSSAKGKETEETPLLDCIICSYYTGGMQADTALISSECWALHLLPLALSVSQLMFLGNTGHGRRRGVYTSMEASEKMVGMWCNRTQRSYTSRYTQRRVLTSERQNSADFEQLNATASTFCDMDSSVIQIPFILSIVSYEQNFSHDNEHTLLS